jgi:antitoxin ParD1/3/4
MKFLTARDHAVESWLHEQVGPAYDALKADTGIRVTALCDLKFSVEA